MASLRDKIRKTLDLDRFERNFMKNVPFAKESKQLAQAYFGIRETVNTQELRDQIKADQDQQFVRMRNAAERAGFNPLTVLRQTGGRGFEIPILSKQAQQNWAEPLINFASQQPIDKYNKEIRKLELEQRRADLAIAKQTLGAMSKATAMGVTGKGNNPEATDSRTAVTTPAGTTSPANVSDAEAYEQRYGDIVQEVAGVSILLSDVYNTGLISAQTAFGKKPSYNNPGRGQMVKKRLEAGILSRPLGRTTPGFGEQWSMYAP
jgi:hypothetical protein